MALKNLTTLFVIFGVLYEISGHGMMLKPTNRASKWRYDWTQPTDYDDNAFFCGGKQVQYEQNGGKCGPCGDNWQDPTPRSNENTGKYGNGVIVANYTVGEVIDVNVLLTANHKGKFYFSVCVLETPKTIDTEECFSHKLNLDDGEESYSVNDLDYNVNLKLQLPEDLKCERCVMRWHYHTGNSWGICPNGTRAVGCGDQETFRSCADISIL